jgi:hypothetical protein
MGLGEIKPWKKPGTRELRELKEIEGIDFES